MSRGTRILMMIPIGIAAITIFVFLGGEIVMLLWNWLLPSLFGVREVTFWQAFGLLALCRILFGGSGFLGGRMSKGHRMSSLTPEERERFRQRIRERWGFGSTSAGSSGTI